MPQDNGEGTLFRVAKKVERGEGTWAIAHRDKDVVLIVGAPAAIRVQNGAIVTIKMTTTELCELRDACEAAITYEKKNAKG